MPAHTASQGAGLPRPPRPRLPASLQQQFPSLALPPPGFHEFGEFVAEDVGTLESGLNSLILVRGGSIFPACLVAQSQIV